MSSPRREAGGTMEAVMEMAKNKISLMLLFVPVAWLQEFAFREVATPISRFILNFGAIIPLSWVISESTEHLEKIVGPMLGTLLNSSFGNVVEIILSVQAIRLGMVKLVQATLLGAIIMNLLAVLGCCFLMTGIKRHAMEFNVYSARYNLGLLSIAALSLTVPTQLAVFDDWSKPYERLQLSRFTAILLFLMYGQWLLFMLTTHKGLFDGNKGKDEVHWFWANAQKLEGEGEGEEFQHHHSSLKHSIVAMNSMGVLTAPKLPTAVAEEEEQEEEEAEPQMNPFAACFILACATLLVTFQCDWLVESIDPVCKEFHVKEAFIATVLLPLVGNFSEVIAAVSIAAKGKLDLAMGVAIGSATQIALCVIPVAVFIAWALDQPLDLDFEVYQVHLLSIAILVAVILTLDHKANWLKGVLLVAAYTIIASSFWFMHDREFVSQGISPEEKVVETLRETAPSPARALASGIGPI